MRAESFLTSFAGSRHLALQMDAATPGGIRDPEPERVPAVGWLLFAIIVGGGVLGLVLR